MSNARDGVGSAPLCDRGAVCGRFSLYEPASDLAERFGIDEVVTHLQTRSMRPQLTESR